MSQILVWTAQAKRLQDFDDEHSGRLESEDDSETADTRHESVDEKFSRVHKEKQRRHVAREEGDPHKQRIIVSISEEEVGRAEKAAVFKEKSETDARWEKSKNGEDRKVDAEKGVLRAGDHRIGPVHKYCQPPNCGGFLFLLRRWARLIRDLMTLKHVLGKLTAVGPTRLKTAMIGCSGQSGATVIGDEESGSSLGGSERML